MSRPGPHPEPWQMLALAPRVDNFAIKCHIAYDSDGKKGIA